MNSHYQTSQRNFLKFSECERPQISKIIVENPYESRVFLHEGLIVEGLRQTRMVAFDVIIEGHATQVIETVCVEQGRWGDYFEGRLTDRAPISVIAALRQNQSPLAGDSKTSRQQSVWQSVERHQARTQNMHTTSLSRMVKSYKESKSCVTGINMNMYEPTSNQCGFIIGQGGEPLLMEVFGSSELFAHHFKSIIESVLWDLDDFGVRSIQNQGTVQFLEEILMLPSASSSAIFSEFRNGLSAKTTSAPKENSILHSLVINHKHPVFN